MKKFILVIVLVLSATLSFAQYKTSVYELTEHNNTTVILAHVTDVSSPQKWNPEVLALEQEDFSIYIWTPWTTLASVTNFHWTPEEIKSMYSNESFQMVDEFINGHLTIINRDGVRTDIPLTTERVIIYYYPYKHNLSVEIPVKIADLIK